MRSAEYLLTFKCQQLGVKLRLATRLFCLISCKSPTAWPIYAARLHRRERVSFRLQNRLDLIDNVFTLQNKLLALLNSLAAAAFNERQEF